MDDLNKHQFILLVLLVTFVTSIATGIITVSLLQQAPVEITRNINSIVERTIERVASTTDNFISSSPSKEVTTVVVKDDDLIVSSIGKNIQSVVRITIRDTIADTSAFYGMGMVISKEGLVITPRRETTSINEYTGTMSDGTQVHLIPTNLESDSMFVIFKANPVSNTKYQFTAASLGSVEPSLGQTVIGIGGDVTNAVSVGRVTSYGMKEMSVGTSTVKYVSSIQNDAKSGDLILGSPFFTLSGDITGFKISGSESSTFVPVTILKRELPKLLESTK